MRQRTRPANWRRYVAWAVKSPISWADAGGRQIITPKYVGNRRLHGDRREATHQPPIGPCCSSACCGTAKSLGHGHLAVRRLCRNVHPAGAGHSRLTEGRRALWMELRPSLSWPEGPLEQALVPSPSWRPWDRGLARDRGSSPHALRRPGHPDHGAQQEDPAVPRLGTGSGRRRIQRLATANDRDRSVSDLSSALQRRFNTASSCLPASARESHRPGGWRNGRRHSACQKPTALGRSARGLVFRELRAGVTDEAHRPESPSSPPVDRRGISAPVIANGP